VKTYCARKGSKMAVKAINAISRLSESLEAFFYSFSKKIL
jgi:hypothetical protein